VVNLSDREISAEIIEACRLGDRDAFRALYEVYKDRVYSISLYFFHGDQAMASDVSQQVFLKLMTSIGQFRGDAGFSTWLRGLRQAPCSFSPRCENDRGCHTARTCLVTFTDSDGIRHSVEVTATTLYEAAALAINEFRRCRSTSNAPGPATRLTVALKTPATSHEVRWGKIEAWLQSAGKPNEQVMKGRLRELLRM